MGFLTLNSRNLLRTKHKDCRTKQPLIISIISKTDTNMTLLQEICHRYTSIQMTFQAMLLQLQQKRGIFMLSRLSDKLREGLSLIISPSDLTGKVRLPFLTLLRSSKKAKPNCLFLKIKNSSSEMIKDQRQGIKVTEGQKFMIFYFLSHE